MGEMFHRLLIANRGEIACRVIATAKRLGLTTVAVYSEADAHALHVERADEAFPLGAAPARESYLSIEKILAVARAARVEAVHPGYGFLSENADFADACAAAGLVFVGPPARAMRLMGDKSRAKALMQEAGVPVVPGFHDAQDIPSLIEAAERIGFPLLVKASAGGGGKGMRVVASANALSEAIESAKREAMSAFGDDRVLLEKQLAQPRHIEAQIFGDAHGGLVAFAERDCSIQRRHQKIIEETPAPKLAATLRSGLREAALAAARAVDYVGAGTVEFLVENDAFYFLEMNTRLQVEHPVTEMIAREDLVEWQLRIAAGEHLPRTQEQIEAQGHAIEARLYAEQPSHGFLPSVGTLVHLRQPHADARLRVETGVRDGDAITPFYDPLIAKIVAWGEDREAARGRLLAALRDYEIIGVETNLHLLDSIVDSADFAAANVDTQFLPRHRELIDAENAALDAADEQFILAAGAAAWLADLREEARMATPFDRLDGWRMNGDSAQCLTFELAGRTIELRLSPLDENRFRLATSAWSSLVEARRRRRRIALRIDGIEREITAVACARGFVVAHHGRNHALGLVDPLAPPTPSGGEEATLAAPLPARVTQVLASRGDEVKKGAPLVMLEAMKMEIALVAPRDGRIAEIRPAIGDMVRQGDALVVFAEGGAA
jgi:3-methylcrotonyl-CoA carboxylase alpha subunit